MLQSLLCGMFNLVVILVIVAENCLLFVMCVSMDVMVLVLLTFDDAVLLIMIAILLCIRLDVYVVSLLSFLCMILLQAPASLWYMVVGWLVFSVLVVLVRNVFSWRGVLKNITACLLCVRMVRCCSCLFFPCLRNFLK